MGRMGKIKSTSRGDRKRSNFLELQRMKKSGAAPGENFWVSRGNKLVESYMYNVFAFGDWRIFQQKENPQYEMLGCQSDRTTLPNHVEELFNLHSARQSVVYQIWYWKPCLIIILNFVSKNTYYNNYWYLLAITKAIIYLFP